MEGIVMAPNKPKTPKKVVRKREPKENLGDKPKGRTNIERNHIEGNSSLERFVTRNPEKAKKMLERALQMRESHFVQQKQTYVRSFERIKGLDISKVKDISQLMQIISPEEISRLAKEISFANRHLRTKYTPEEILELERISASFEKFSKVLSKVKDNPKKFDEKAIQELLFWLKREKSIPDSTNLEHFVNGVISGKRTIKPENIDLKTWKLINEFADSRYFADNAARINYLERLLKLPKRRLAETIKQMKKELEKQRKREIKERGSKKSTISQKSALSNASILNITLGTMRNIKTVKNVEDLIRVFDIKTFEKNFNELKKYIEEPKNKLDSLYLDLLSVYENSNLLLKSMKTIIENKSKFTGKNFTNLKEILMDPKKIQELDYFVWQTIVGKPKKENLLEFDKVVEEPLDKRLDKKQESKKVETTRPAENTDIFNTYLLSMLGKKYGNAIQLYVGNITRFIVYNGGSVKINGLNANLITTTNGAVLKFKNNQVLELFENVQYILTNDALIYKHKGRFWDSVKKHNIPDILKSKEPKIQGILSFRNGKLIMDV